MVMVIELFSNNEYVLDIWQTERTIQQRHLRLDVCWNERTRPRRRSVCGCRAWRQIRLWISLQTDLIFLPIQILKHRTNPEKLAQHRSFFTMPFMYRLVQSTKNPSLVPIFLLSSTRDFVGDRYCYTTYNHNIYVCMYIYIYVYRYVIVGWDGTITSTWHDTFSYHTSIISWFVLSLCHCVTLLLLLGVTQRILNWRFDRIEESGLW